MTRTKNVSVLAFPSKFTNISLKDEWPTPLDKIFDEAFGKLFPDAVNSFGLSKDPFRQASYPKVNVYGHKDRIEIEAELAGVKKDDVSIEIEENKLIISGQSSFETKADAAFIIHELSRSKFRRSFLLDLDQLDVDKIDASFEDGLLTISIPKVLEKMVETKRVVDIR